MLTNSYELCHCLWDHQESTNEQAVELLYSSLPPPCLPFHPKLFWCPKCCKTIFACYLSPFSAILVFLAEGCRPRRGSTRRREWQLAVGRSEDSPYSDSSDYLQSTPAQHQVAHFSRAWACSFADFFFSQQDSFFRYSHPPWLFFLSPLSYHMRYAGTSSCCSFAHQITLKRPKVTDFSI